MRNLLVVTAALEGTTGLALVALPSQLAALLLGSSLDAPAAMTLARIAGVALLALAVTCWLGVTTARAVSEGWLGRWCCTTQASRSCSRSRASD